MGDGRRGRGPVQDREQALAVVWGWIDGLDGRDDWTGTGGGSRRAVAEALGMWALRRGGFRFTAALDEVAVEAGVHRHTARLALRCLVERGLVARIGAPTATRASRWQLLGGLDGGGSSDFGALGDDWARFAAVGKRAAMAWRSCIGGATLVEVADGLGVSTDTARHHLRRLIGIGLVERRDGRHHALEPDGVAVLFGTAGMRAAQWDDLLRQRQERAGFRSLTGAVRGSHTTRH